MLIYVSSDEALPAFEELFIHACPKFITANPPPYDDPQALAVLLSPSSPSPNTPAPSVQQDSSQRHLALFLADVSASAQVPTLRSFLKLYTSLGTSKLANFLDTDEEEMIQEMMVMKQASRSVSRVVGGEGTHSGTGGSKGLLDGETISTSDLNFVIDGVSIFSITLFLMTDFASFLGHGAYRGIDHRASLRRLVHKKYRTGPAYL